MTQDDHAGEHGSPSFVYFGTITPGRTRANPAGVVRRRVVDGHPIDEAFTRRLRWERTTALIDHRFGHNDVDHVEITEAEAAAFTKRVAAKILG